MNKYKNHNRSKRTYVHLLLEQTCTLYSGFHEDPITKMDSLTTPKEILFAIISNHNVLHCP